MFISYRLGIDNGLRECGVILKNLNSCILNGTNCLTWNATIIIGIVIVKNAIMKNIKKLWVKKILMINIKYEK